MRLTANEAQVFYDLDLFVTETPAILWLHKLCSKCGYSFEWKTAKLTNAPKWEDNYLYNGSLSASRCIKTVITFQQQVVFNIKIKGSVQKIQKIGNIIRSSADSK